MASEEPTVVDAPEPNQSHEDAGWAARCFVAAAATSLSLGVWIDQGNRTPGSMLGLSFALLCMLAALCWRGGREPLWAGMPVSRVTLASCLLLQLAVLAARPLDIERSLPRPFWLTLAVCSAAASLPVLYLLAKNRLPGWFSTYWGLLAALGGLAVLVLLPTPRMDVITFSHGGVHALLKGYNPYAIQFPDLYSPERSAALYGPGMSSGGVLRFGYPYSPWSLLLGIPGVLLGDPRYSCLTAMLVAAAFIARTGPAHERPLASALLLFTPLFPLVTWLAWTESHVLLCVAAVCYARAERPALLPYVFGVLLVSKQYMLGLAPLALLLIPQPWSARRLAAFLFRAGAVSALLSLPFVLRDPGAFYRSAVELQLRQPPRWDSMTYVALLHPDATSPWLLLPFATLSLAMLFALVRAQTTPIGFALPLAWSLALFFAFSKQGAVNYYYLVVGTLCCALVEPRAGASAPRTQFLMPARENSDRIGPMRRRGWLRRDARRARVNGDALPRSVRE